MNSHADRIRCETRRGPVWFKQLMSPHSRFRTMSISLIVRNRLWGLISCLNHTGPRRVSHRMRSACEFMGRLASLQIAAFEDRELISSRASRRATEDALHRAMKEAPGSVLAALVPQPRG